MNAIQQPGQDTRPPSSSPGLPRQRRIVALTRDETLARALEELALLGEDVVHVTATHDFAEALVAIDAHIALVDADALERTPDTLVDQITTQFPDLRLIVAGHAREQSLLASRIAAGCVFRFVHKPASAQRLKLFVDAASRATESARLSQSQTVEVLREAPAVSGGGERRKLRAALPWLLAGVAGIAALAPAVRFMGGGDEAAAPAPPAVAAPPPPSSDELDELLRSAEVAFTEGRLDDAEGALSTARVRDPGNPRLAFLTSQLQRERERKAAEENRRLGAQARQERLRNLLLQANQRLDDGQLLEPGSDGALDLYFAALEIAPNDEGVRAFRDQLGARLVEAAAEKLEQGDVDGARTLLDGAGSLGSEAEAVARLRRRADELGAASMAPVLASAAPTPSIDSTDMPAPALEASAAPPPPETGASDDGPPESRIYKQSDLTLVRQATIEYPDDALQRGIAGWVDVEFTVATDGSVRNIIVLDAEPRHVFESAAQASLRRWRYRPVMENGVAVDARARLRLRFTPPAR